MRTYTAIHKYVSGV